MKRNIKKELIERKHNDIFADFCKMFESGLHQDLIYVKLEKKYYIDKKTIYRVLLKKKEVLPDNQYINNVT